MTLCEACNCYPCCCGGERKTMEAPERIWAWPSGQTASWYSGGCSYDVNLGLAGLEGEQQAEYVRADLYAALSTPAITERDVSELTENLRDSGARSECEAYEDRIDAADEIDRLTARVADLEAALLTCEVEASYTPHNPACEKVIKAARAALGKGK